VLEIALGAWLFASSFVFHSYEYAVHVVEMWSGAIVVLVGIAVLLTGIAELRVVSFCVGAWVLCSTFAWDAGGPHVASDVLTALGICMTSAALNVGFAPAPQPPVAHTAPI
jgi:hypothetical protein